MWRRGDRVGVGDGCGGGSGGVMGELDSGALQVRGFTRTTQRTHVAVQGSAGSLFAPDAEHVLPGERQVPASCFFLPKGGKNATVKHTQAVFT